jgi:hypothetical protein
MGNSGQGDETGAGRERRVECGIGGMELPQNRPAWADGSYLIQIEEVGHGDFRHHAPGLYGRPDSFAD